MRVVKPEPLLLSCSPSQRGHVAEMGISVGVGFRLSDPRILQHESHVWRAVSGTPTCAPLHEQGRTKRFAEWLLVGHACSPFNAQQVGHAMDWTTELRLGASSKAVSAKSEVRDVGEGRFEARLLVDHSQSSQGLHLRNPMGKAGPNAPLQGLGWVGAREAPLAGMGPIDSRWPDCMQWAPSFGQDLAARAKDGTHRAWPADTDLRFFQQAPSDQWAAQSAWPTQAPYKLSGFGPGGGGFEGHLPPLRAEVALQRKGAEEAASVALALQTVWFLPDHDLAVLWWTGSAPLSHMLDDSIGLIVASLREAQAYDDPAHLLQLAQRRTQLTSMDYLAQCDSLLLPPVESGWTWEQVRRREDIAQAPSSPKNYPTLRMEVAEVMAELKARAGDQTQHAAHDNLPAVAPQVPVQGTRALALDWRTRLQAAEQRVLRHQTLRDQDLSGLVLQGWVWEDVRLERCILDQAQLAACQFDQVKLVDCSLLGVCGRDLRWSDGGLQRCTLQQGSWDVCHFERLHWEACTVAQTRFQRSTWSESLISEGAWHHTLWAQSSLQHFALQGMSSGRDWHWSEVTAHGISLMDSALSAMRFERCKLEKFSALETQLDHSQWLNCRCHSLNLTHGTVLNRALWCDCEVSQACWIDLTAQDLEVDHCTFKQLNAQGLQAPHSRWTYTVLTGANFLNASLPGSLLEHSALRGATLVGAELRHSHARHCNLIQADLSESTLPEAGAWHSNLEGRCITAPRRTP